MIGAGAMANKVHYPSLASFPDVEFAGVCDIDPQRLQKTADQYQIEKRYTDYRKMIEEVAPDGVFAVGQPHYMYDIWLWCLQHGLNLFVEKPLGLTAHQARMLAYLADKHGCITQAGFQRRTCPLLVKLRDELLQRTELEHAVCVFTKYVKGAYVDAPSQMMNNGTHVLDTLRWMCGGEVLEVESVSRRIQAPDINFFTAQVLFDSGVVGTALMNMTAPRRWFGIEMHGCGVSVIADTEGLGQLYLADGKDQEFDTRKVAGSDEFHVFGGFQAKDREFINAIQNGGQPSSHFGDAVKTIELAESILAQARLLGE
jgi:predicted dehydrogenase